LEACPELETPAAPVRPHPTGRPGTAFRSHNSVGVRHDSISELNLRGLLPCCVRFAPTSRPVNGNTRYRPACSRWPGGTCTRWIPTRGFTCSCSAPPLPSFSQRDIRLFQQATICSVKAWRALRFRRICASFSASSPPKRPVKTIWLPVDGPMDFGARAAAISELIQWSPVDAGSARRAGIRSR
jgi:hypothetical protein